MFNILYLKQTHPKTFTLLSVGSVHSIYCTKPSSSFVFIPLCVASTLNGNTPRQPRTRPHHFHSRLATQKCVQFLNAFQTVRPNKTLLPLHVRTLPSDALPVSKNALSCMLEATNHVLRFHSHYPHIRTSCMVSYFLYYHCHRSAQCM